MVHREYRGKQARQRQVKKSGSICLKLVDESVYGNILVESANMWRNFVIDRTDDVSSGDSETGRPRCFGYKWFHQETVNWLSIMTIWLWSKMITQQMPVGMSPRWASTEIQRSVNNLILIFSAIRGFYHRINPKSSYWLALDVKWQATCSLPHPRNERHWGATYFCSCIMDKD
jgi:hypothetical protein